MVKHTRWFFNVKRWKPSREEWLNLTTYVEANELDRCYSYNYQDDCKFSLVGRAMIRKFVSENLNRKSNEPILVRSAHERPEIDSRYKQKLGKDWPGMLDFNISHSGEHCVLAGFYSSESHQTSSVGVDVCKVVAKKGKELEDFLALMKRREFTKNEWSTVEEAKSDRQKCINFTRLWCLKESYVKANGLGIGGFKLSRIDFQCDTQTHSRGLEPLRDQLISSTTALLDGQVDESWTFLEGSLDDEHLVAVGYQDFPKTLEIDMSPFAEISIQNLLVGLSPFGPACEERWTSFNRKPTKEG